MGDPEVQFTCCFCGGATTDASHVTLAVIWEENGEEYEQSYFAHRTCFVDRMTDEAREAGGPFFGEFDDH